VAALLRVSEVFAVCGTRVARVRRMTFHHLLVAAVVAGVFQLRVPSAFAQTAAVAGPLPSPKRESLPAWGVNSNHTVPPPMVYRLWYRYTLQAIDVAQQFDVGTENGSIVIARCVGQCTLGLPEGRYNLQPYDKQGHALRGTSFEVTGPGRLQFEPANTELAAAGAVLGSAGGVLLVVGSVLLMNSICIDNCENDRTAKAPLALAALAASAVMTPIGWYLFAHHLRPRVEASPTAGVQLGGAVNRDGGLLGIKGSF